MLAGAMPVRPQPLTALSAFDYRKKKDRREYVRVSLSRDANGHVLAQRFPKDGAALISSLIAADALAELDENTTDIRVGDAIAVLPLASLQG
jgi:molybdopterin molybdotransferase